MACQYCYLSSHDAGREIVIYKLTYKHCQGTVIPLIITRVHLHFTENIAIKLKTTLSGGT